MTRKTFKNLIIKPLNKEFNTIIYFNGYEAHLKNLYLPPKSCGAAFISQTIKPIVIIWQRNFYDTIQTLFHELGHISLHGKGSNFRGRSAIQEIEAEMVAFKTCELLILPYNPNFKLNKDINFINSYSKLISKNTYPREILINNCAMKIYNLLKDIKIWKEE